MKNQKSFQHNDCYYVVVLNHKRLSRSSSFDDDNDDDDENVSIEDNVEIQFDTFYKEFA